MQSAGQEFLDIISRLEQTEREVYKKKRSEEKSTSAYRVGSRVFWYGFVGPAIISLVLALAVWLGAPRELLYISVTLLLITYIVIVAYPLLGVWLYRGAIKDIFRAPFSNLVRSNVERPLQIDSLYLPEILQLAKGDLQLGVMELKNARHDFEQRIAVVAGPIKTVGILPGLLATLVAFQQLDGQPVWAQAIAYANPLVFFMAVVGHHFLARYDRMISLAELALAIHEEKHKLSSGSLAVELA